MSDHPEIKKRPNLDSVTTINADGSHHILHPADVKGRFTLARRFMAAIMIGDRTSPEALAFTGSTTLAPVHGELIMAFDPARFAQGRPGNPLDRAEVLFDAILGTGARLPSQRRFMAREKSKAEGIALNADEIQILQQLLDQTAP